MARVIQIISEVKPARLNDDRDDDTERYSQLIKSKKTPN